MSCRRRIRPLAPLALLACTLAAGCGGDGEGDGEPRVLRWGGDLIAGGPVLAIPDSIPGDVMIAGRDLDFTGFAGGDYLGAGQELAIGGRVLGDVRAAGRAVDMTGRVGGNATVAGQRVSLGGGAVVGRNAYLAGGTVRMGGTVTGYLRAAGGEVVLDGSVGGDVRVDAERLTVGPGARIAGDLRYRVPPENVTISPEAQVAGGTTALRPRPRPDMQAPIRFFHLFWLLGFLAAGAVVVALFPDVMAAAAAALRRAPAAALGWGLVWVIGVPIAATVVALTIVGVPLALIVAALYVISLYLGRAVVALWLGRLVLRGWARRSRGRLVVAFLAGGVILVILALIPVLGPLVMLVATVLGLGALVAAFRDGGTESH